MIAMMRSNDAYLGFPHDVFCFTMIQELIARSLGIRVGEYHHFATSLHLYEDHVAEVTRYLGEGFQSPTFAMPKMPPGCQRENLRAFLEVESLIRNESITRFSQIKLPTYWRDLSLVLLRHADSKKKRGMKHLEKNFSHISDGFYKNFFVKRPQLLPKSHSELVVQDKLNLGD